MTAAELLHGGLAALGVTDEALAHLEAALGRPLPESYRAFLRISNGCDTDAGSLWVVLYPAEAVAEATQRYREALHGDPRLNDTVFIGTDGGGEAYVILYGSEGPRFGALRYIGDGLDDLLYEAGTLDAFVSNVASA